jgi:hypothetical protein
MGQVTEDGWFLSLQQQEGLSNFSLKVQGLEHKANRFLSVAKIMNECNCTCTPTTDLILCALLSRGRALFLLAIYLTML